MPNDRNEDALAAMLRDLSAGWPQLSPEDCMQIAIRLANMGVLVPSTATDDELRLLSERSGKLWAGQDIRTGLERIARGEG